MGYTSHAIAYHPEGYRLRLPHILVLGWLLRSVGEGWGDGPLLTASLSASTSMLAAAEHIFTRLTVKI